MRIWLVLFMFIASIAYGANSTISDFTEDASPTGDDWLLSVDVGTSANKKVAITNITKGLPAASPTVNGILNATVDYVKFNSSVQPTRYVNTTAPLTGGANLSSDVTIVIPKANATVDGYLNATVDWVKFNASAVGTDLTNHTGNATPHVSATNRTEWDTAYGWGDHGTEGYAIGTDLTNHTGNATPHVSATNRTAWDGAVSNDTAFAAGWNGTTGQSPSQNAVYDKIITMGTSNLTANDTAYGAGWNGTTGEVPSQNAVYDKIETIAGGSESTTVSNTSDIEMLLAASDINATLNATLKANWNTAYTNKKVQFAVSQPANLTNMSTRATPSRLVWLNGDTRTYTINNITVISDFDTYNCSMFKSASSTDINVTNDTLMQAVSTSDDGIGGYYKVYTSPTNATIETNKYLIFEHTNGTPASVQVYINGSY